MKKDERDTVRTEKATTSTFFFFLIYVMLFVSLGNHHPSITIFKNL